MCQYSTSNVVRERCHLPFHKHSSTHVRAMKLLISTRHIRTSWEGRRLPWLSVTTLHREDIVVRRVIIKTLQSGSNILLSASLFVALGERRYTGQRQPLFLLVTDLYLHLRNLMYIKLISNYLESPFLHRICSTALSKLSRFLRLSLLCANIT